jgi:hypothetical protein
VKTIAQRWEEFRGWVMPPGVHESQVREMRRAFYAGFHASLMAGLEMADESGPNDDVGATMIQRLHEECQRFAADIQAGRA